MRSLAIAALLFWTLQASAAAEPALPRSQIASIEPLGSVQTRFGELLTPQGWRLRTITTRPLGSQGLLPAVYFAQWLSCDSVELTNSADGWSSMLRGLVQSSGMVVVRLDKAGVGDSEGGPCAALDYETELEHHRLAMQMLRADPWVDPDRIFIFGASMGTTFAPLLAQSGPVRGVAVWGGGAFSWFERQIALERRALELSAVNAGELDARIRSLSAAYAAVLLEGRTPAELQLTQPQLAADWARAIGADEDGQFGRPIAFHQQAQRHHWAEAWARVDAPVLVVLGEFDSFERYESAALIGVVVNQKHPDRASVHCLPGIDHHFSRYETATAAFAGRGGQPDSDAFLKVLLPWLHQHTEVKAR